MSDVRGQQLDIRGQTSDVSGQSDIRKDSDFLIIPLNIRPISAQWAVRIPCFSGEMYWQSLAKSRAESVSLFSPSQSVSLLTKCASYRRFAHASRRFKQIDRDERRIWLVSAYFSSDGNF